MSAQPNLFRASASPPPKAGVYYNPAKDEFFRADLAAAWRAVEAIAGPGLESSAPLGERNRVFAERLAAFRSAFGAKTVVDPQRRTGDSGL